MWFGRRCASLSALAAPHCRSGLPVCLCRSRLAGWLELELELELDNGPKMGLGDRPRQLCKIKNFIAEIGQTPLGPKPQPQPSPSAPPPKRPPFRCSVLSHTSTHTRKSDQHFSLPAVTHTYFYRPHHAEPTAPYITTQIPQFCRSRTTNQRTSQQNLQ